VTAEASAPRAYDVTTPSTARMYDYYLGGKDNYPADRAAADKVLASAPEIRRVAMENRAFLGRAVRFLAAAGIQQFIDVGAGLPTRGNVHEVAQDACPTARVAYVDHDPVVCAHARALLSGTANVEVIEADMHDPQAVLGHEGLRTLIDPDQPVAVLFISVLHFTSDASRIVADFRHFMAPGSHLALSHGVPEEVPGGSGSAAKVKEVYDRSSSPTGAFRTREEIMDLFDGFDLAEPGLVPVSAWRPDRPADLDERVWLLAGAGRLMA
jgi:SAM-dependent methyltransferase